MLGNFTLIFQETNFSLIYKEFDEKQVILKFFLETKDDRIARNVCQPSEESVTLSCTNDTPRKFFQVMVHLTGILHVYGSNFNRDTGLSGWHFVHFISSSR